jgi:hypothetical protein
MPAIHTMLDIRRLTPYLIDRPDDRLVRWTHGNSKLPNSTMILSLPAGHSCPGALACHTRVPRHGGSAITGPDLQFACYAASQERYRRTVRDLRWANFDALALQDARTCLEILATSFFRQHRGYTQRVRFFESGDCFSAALAEAIVCFALAVQPMVVYLYTKNLPVWLRWLQDLPPNLRITASWGGRYDDLIDGLFDRSARVVQNEAEARSLSLPVDFDDSLAYGDTPLHFAHLVHGWQPKGSAAGEAINERRRRGEFTGYGSTFTPSHQASPA